MKFRYLIFQIISVIDGWGISCELALRWMSLDLTDDKSTLVQIMAWCRQATSHYLSQCWPRSLSPYGVTRPQWVLQAELLWGNIEINLPGGCWWPDDITAAMLLTYPVVSLEYSGFSTAKSNSVQSGLVALSTSLRSMTSKSFFCQQGILCKSCLKHYITKLVQLGPVSFNALMRRLSKTTNREDKKIFQQFITGFNFE